MSGAGSVARRASTTPILRRATGSDAAALSALALRSKAVWGYDAAFMAACRVELTITPAAIAERPTWVLEDRGALVGFYQLRIEGRMAEVAQIFIAPGNLQGGLGRRLWAHLEAAAGAQGCTWLEVDSDPHAEGFYRAMGMIRHGEAPSGSIPGACCPIWQRALVSTARAAPRWRPLERASSCRAPAVAAL